MPDYTVWADGETEVHGTEVMFATSHEDAAREAATSLGPFLADPSTGHEWTFCVRSMGSPVVRRFRVRADLLVRYVATEVTG